MYCTKLSFLFIFYMQLFFFKKLKELALMRIRVYMHFIYLGDGSSPNRMMRKKYKKSILTREYAILILLEWSVVHTLV